MPAVQSVKLPPYVPPAVAQADAESVRHSPLERQQAPVSVAQTFVGDALLRARGVAGAAKSVKLLLSSVQPPLRRLTERMVDVATPVAAPPSQPLVVAP